MNFSKIYCVVLALISLFIISGCGNGGSVSQSSSLKGVAATGAPIVGTVTLTDSKGAQLGPNPTDMDGNFSFDVTGLTPPYLLVANWTSNSRSRTLASVALSSGTANINPFSDLSLQIISSTDPTSNILNHGRLDLNIFTSPSVSAAQLKIQTLLAPIFAKYDITEFNPITGTYTATPDNKLDTLLDIISITVSNGIFTITNNLDGSTIASGSLSNLVSVTPDITKCPDSVVLTDIKEITQTMSKLRDVMNLGTALTVNATEDLFFPGPNYGISNGNTRAQDMASILSIFGPNGTSTIGKLKSIRNVRLVSDLSNSYSGRGVVRAYLLNYDFIYESGLVVHGNDVTFAKELTSGLWKFIGSPTGSNQGSNYGAVFFQDSITINIGIDYIIPVLDIVLQEQYAEPITYSGSSYQEMANAPTAKL